MAPVRRQRRRRWPAMRAVASAVAATTATANPAGVGQGCEVRLRSADVGRGPPTRGEVWRSAAIPEIWRMVTGDCILREFLEDAAAARNQPGIRYSTVPGRFGARRCT